MRSVYFHLFGRTLVTGCYAVSKEQNALFIRKQKTPPTGLKIATFRLYNRCLNYKSSKTFKDEY